MQLAIFAAAVILALLVTYRVMFPDRASLRNARSRERRTDFGASNPYHAVSIQPGEAGCPAVASIQVQRFLSEDAPALPLADCNAVDCQCKYIHYNDRRSSVRDRRLGSPEGADASEFWSLRDRRRVFGRRVTDQQLA